MRRLPVERRPADADNWWVEPMTLEQAHEWRTKRGLDAEPCSDPSDQPAQQGTSTAQE